MDRMVTLYISDQAYDCLTAEAQAAGYLHQSRRGLYKYVADMMQRTLTDLRPLYVREGDRARRAAGNAPEWRLWGPRKPRELRVSEATLVWASAHAIILGMTALDTKLRGAPSALDSEQCLAAILEAWGTGWIGVKSDASTQ